jgi:hypothetical protein
LKEEKDPSQEDPSGTVTEINQGSSQKSEVQDSNQGTTNPIPATFPDWWGRLAPPDDLDDKVNCEYTLNCSMEGEKDSYTDNGDRHKSKICRRNPFTIQTRKSS